MAPFACSSDGESEISDEISSGGSGPNGSTSKASATSSGANGSIDIDEGSTVGNVDGEACVAEVSKADLVDIDIHLMLDSSGSMLEQLPNGVSKWEAVVGSLIEFLEDPATTDIGIGVQYFPLLRPGTSLECTTDDDCGSGAGPCSSSACVLELSAQGDTYWAINDSTTQGTCDGDGACAGDETCKPWLGVCATPDAASGDYVLVGDPQDNILVCEANGDCPLGTCDLLGFCEEPDPDGLPILCSGLALPCPADAGDCYLIPYACTNATLCEADDYATPAVEISTAVDRNEALVSSLTSRMPEGLTPTAPALAGAIEHARARESELPERKVVAVLATDGLPTECEPLEIADISQVAQAGLQGTPSVETYVIGVFSSAEAMTAQANLDQIAEAGGTGEAFVISTGSDVASEFLQSLNEIRGAALACDFAIPEPPAGESLDFGKVNLEFVDGSGNKRQLVNVSDEAACSEAPSTGWYYVRDDAGEATQISVCPDVCDEFKATMGATEVNLQIGCATIVR